MSRDTFSTYEAKARFSELLRRVRAGRTVTVTYHGRPVAELRPVDRVGGTEARIKALEGRGAVVSSGERSAIPRPLATRPGALARFLHDRDG